MRSAIGLTVILLLILALPWEVRADFRQFIPKISNYSGFLTVDSSYEQQDDTTNGRGLKTKDLFLRETLDLSTVGYIYDPRFITILLKLSGGVKQESFSIGSRSQNFKNMTAEQYTFRMFVLPEHPYNLEIFALRVEPLTRRAFQQSGSVAYSKGAVFRYRKKPYFVNAHYLDNTTESPVGSYTTKKYGVLATYYKELGGEKFYSYSGSYEHTSYTGGGSADEAAIGNNYFLKTMRFSSNLSYGRSSQKQGGIFSLALSNETINWAERAHFNLPWNFGAGLSFVWNKNRLKTSGDNVAEQNISTTSRAYGLNITQQLYHSLLTHYDLGYASLNSETGTSTTLTNGLGLVYSKDIPWGRLRIEASGDRTNTKRRGVQAIPGELHRGVRVPGSFTLDNPDADPSTIFVYLRSPVSPEGIAPLVENVDYIVQAFENTFRITIVNLPSQFVIPGTYDIFVSYSLNNAESSLVTTNLNYSLSFELFSEFFPYYNHSKSSQTVSGLTDQVPWNFTSDVFGFLFAKGPLNLSASYFTVRSNVNPSKGWKANATYVKNIAEETQMQAAANYSYTNYPEGLGLGGVSYTERLYGASAALQRTIRKHNMTFSIVGAYSRDEALASSNTYSFTSSYVWKVGKLYLSAGATGSLTQTSFSGGNGRRTYQYYYLTVKRRLF